MNEKRRELRAKGECDYDYVHDILFFKVKNREYEKSIELEHIVVDIDNKNFIVGMQIFDASEYFDIPKKHLRTAINWKLQAKVDRISKTRSRLEIRLLFQIKIRNRILQPTPIITQNVKDSLPNSKMISVPAR